MVYESSDLLIAYSLNIEIENIRLLSVLLLEPQQFPEAWSDRCSFQDDVIFDAKLRWSISF